MTVSLPRQPTEPVRPDFDQLYRRYRGVVARRVGRFVDAERAEELVQEVFERAVRHQDGFRGRSSTVTWLYQIATRVSLNHLRDTQRRTELLEHWGTPPWGRPSMGADQETLIFARHVWATLDPELLEIGAYHFIDGLTQDEIAALIGVSRRTVGHRLQSLREDIRRAMETP